MSKEISAVNQWREADLEVWGWSPGAKPQEFLLNLINIFTFPGIKRSFYCDKMSISINVKSVSTKTITVWNVHKPAASIEFH